MNTPMIDTYARRLDSFIQTMADGKVDDAELKAQEGRLASLMKEIEPKLDDSPEIRQFKPENSKFSTKVDWNLSRTQNGSFRGSYNSNFSPAGAPNGRNSLSTTTESKNRTFVLAASLNSVPSNR